MYKPVEQRKYGYYVLPVLQGEKIVARVEPRLEKDRPILRIDHWWWEKNVSRSEEMEEALIECVVDFANYLEAEEIKLTASIRRRPSLGWLVEAGKRLAGR